MHFEDKDGRFSLQDHQRRAVFKSCPWKGLSHRSVDGIPRSGEETSDDQDYWRHDHLGGSDLFSRNARRKQSLDWRQTTFKEKIVVENISVFSQDFESKTDSMSEQLDIFLYSTLTMTEWILLTLLLVYVIFKTEFILTEPNNRLEVLSEKVILRNNSEAWMQIFNDICHAEMFEYRAWDVFASTSTSSSLSCRHC